MRGLENTCNSTGAAVVPFHHMRGLENVQRLHGAEKAASHHMRGLETKAPTTIYLNERFPPHAWLRN